MDIRPYVEIIRHQLMAAAEAGGDEARAVAERLTAAVDSTVRLALQDALVAAAEEITCELAPGSVELRLRGRDPEFVVRQPAAFAGGPPGAGLDEAGAVEGREAPVTGAGTAAETGDGGMARVNLRMRDQLKARAEQAAANERVSLNAWLVKVVTAAVDRAGPQSALAPLRCLAASAMSGWARSLPPSQFAKQRGTQGGHMPTFDTPAPISVSVDIGAGSLEIITSDRADTVVEVRPTDPAKKVDVGAAEQTQVSYSDGTLTLKAPRNWRQYVPWSEDGSVDVKIELPSGSRLRGEAGVGVQALGPTGRSELRGTGLLGECTFKVGCGDIQLSQAGPLQLRTGAGDVTVERAVGHSEITTWSGAVHVSRTEGTAVIKSSNGDIWVGEAKADLRVTTANGKISGSRWPVRMSRPRRPMATSSSTRSRAARCAPRRRRAKSKWASVEAWRRYWTLRPRGAKCSTAWTHLARHNRGSHRWKSGRGRASAT